MAGKRLNHDARRLLLVEAACEVIGERGLYNFRVRDVAQAAGVSQPLVSHHFQTRGAIIEAAFDYAEEVSNRIMAERAAQGADSYEMVLAWLLGMLDEDPNLAVSHKMWYEIWFNGTRSDAHAKIARAGQRTWLATVEALIATGQTDGTLLADEPAGELAMMCSAMVDGLQPAIRFDFLTSDAARALVLTAARSILKPVGDRPGEG